MRAPPLLAGADRVRHHVHLGAGGVGAPDDQQVGLRHLSRVGAREFAGAGDETVPGERRADGGVEAGIALGVAQAVDAVALHEAHRAGIIVGPDGLRAELRLRFQELLGAEVERGVPGNPLELARALGAGADHRVEQPVRMVDALGVARDLGADHAGGIVVVACAPDAADAAGVEAFDLERAGRGAIVRARAEMDGRASVHG